MELIGLKRKKHMPTGFYDVNRIAKPSKPDVFVLGRPSAGVRKPKSIKRAAASTRFRSKLREKLHL